MFFFVLFCHKTLEFKKYTEVTDISIYVLRASEMPRSNHGHTITLSTYTSHDPNNVSTTYQLSTPYSFRDIVWTHF